MMIFKELNAYENVICNMAAILFWPKCVKRNPSKLSSVMDWSGVKFGVKCQGQRHFRLPLLLIVLLDINSPICDLKWLPKASENRGGGY